MSVNNHRKCAKCGRTRAEDMSVTYHRFPQPGKANIIKARLWAKYCWPNKDWTSVESLQSLHTSNKVLCGRHFNSSQFYDNQRQKLSIFAVPDESELDETLKDKKEHEVVMVDKSTNCMLEVCIDSLESALNAVHGGADELEVCSSLSEGGLTPTVGLVREILVAVNKIISRTPIYKTCHQESCSCLNLQQKPKVNVMIRCRTGSDFCFSNQEMDTMLSDVKIFKEIGVDRFVFGALTNAQNIDVENCAKILKAAHPIPVTFHRAFDVCKDFSSNVEEIINLGFNRLLTSGQRSSADDVEAIKVIEYLLSMFGDKIEIMPGAGVSVENAKMFTDLGCKIVHSSCKVLRVLPKVENSLSMGSNDSECIYVTDADIVRKMKETLCSNNP